MKLEEDRDVRAAVLDSLKWLKDQPKNRHIRCCVMPFLSGCQLRNRQATEEDPETDIVNKMIWITKIQKMLCESVSA